MTYMKLPPSCVFRNNDLQNENCYIARSTYHNDVYETKVGPPSCMFRNKGLAKTAILPEAFLHTYHNDLYVKDHFHVCFEIKV